MSNYGRILRYMRTNANKTLEESAKLCGHTKAWLSDIERGSRRIAFDDAMKLLEFYNADFDEIREMLKE